MQKKPAECVAIGFQRAKLNLHTTQILCKRNLTNTNGLCVDGRNG